MTQLKTVGTQKRSPFPPAAGHPPFPPSEKIRNVIEPLLGGKGAPFCSTLQLSHSFKMLNWFYKWRLWRYIFVWEKLLPQSHRAAASVIPALNRQGGNIRVAASSAVVFLLPKCQCLLRRSLWSRVRALPPLSGPMILPAPVADLP